MTGLLDSLAELHSTTPHNRWNKDAQLLYMWNSLHGAHIINEGARHDFVPSYVRRNCNQQQEQNDDTCC